MRNDQLAVFCRDMAGRFLQWASVLEKEDTASDADYKAILTKHVTELLSPAPSDVPTTDQGTPSPTDGGHLPDDVRHRLALDTLNGNLYEALLTYLVQFSPSKVYRSRDGRLMISKYAVLTDAEIMEALR